MVNFERINKPTRNFSDSDNLKIERKLKRKELTQRKAQGKLCKQLSQCYDF